MDNIEIFTKWIQKSTSASKLIQGFLKYPGESDISLMLITQGRDVILIKEIHEKDTIYIFKIPIFEKALPISSLWALKIISNKTSTT